MAKQKLWTEKEMLQKNFKWMTDEEMWKRFYKLGITEKRFGFFQMHQMQLGMNAGLSDSQIKIMAKPRLNWKQVREIRIGFYYLTNTEVRSYAKVSIWHTKMQEIREKLGESKKGGK